MNRGFDVLDERRTTLILVSLVTVVFSYVLCLQTAKSSRIHRCTKLLQLSLSPWTNLTGKTSDYRQGTRPANSLAPSSTQSRLSNLQNSPPYLIQKLHYREHSLSLPLSHTSHQLK